MTIRHMFLFIYAILIISTELIAQSDIWVENSFEDFIDGTFDDSGANMYISHNGLIQPINRWDVNTDGYIDILCVNSHSLVEMLDMSIYWGNGKDFSIKNHSYIPANGPMWVTADDLNNDGEMDIVVANYSNGTWTEMESFVYYGGLEKSDRINTKEWAHYPFKKRLGLPSSNAQKAITGDYNNDGYKDIVLAFSGGFWEYRDKSKESTSISRIYWGNENDFSSNNFTNISTASATDVASADLNSDGWLDLVFANSTGGYSFIYYGAVEGFDNSRLTKLPTISANAVELGDINNDGAIDIVFAFEKGDISSAYLNIDGAFDDAQRIDFETFTAKDAVIEDFNQDGFTDVFFSNHQFSITGNPNLANRLIDSFIYYGSSEGFSKENRHSIQTIGAWGANAADLNDDGWIDLLICNFQEHYSYEVPSFIYWNGPEGFKQTMRTNLYEHGAQGNCITDFNGDGYLDILITSMMGNSRGGYDPSYLYFGQNDGGFSVDERTELVGREAYEQAFADLDNDGDVDILIVNRGEVNRLANEVWIYWNEDGKFNNWSITGLQSYNGLGVQVADLDKDGYLDIIVSNGNPRNIPNKSSEGSFIYWGYKNEWPVMDRTVLPIELTRSATVCDINNDGNLDLVFGNQMKGGLATIFYGDGSREYNIYKSLQLPKSMGTGSPGVADLNKDGLLDIAFAHNTNALIYFQNKKYKFDEPIKLPVQAKTMTIADVNGDDWLDLVCPFYRGEGRRSWFSTIFLGSKNGFDTSDRIELPTDGATGSLVCDFNQDGYQDVFFYCHRADGSYDEIKKFGDHHVNSVLYWGSKKGFSPDNSQKLPSIGAHYDMGVDIGNINDRKPLFKYISSAYNFGDKHPDILVWNDGDAANKNIKFQLRFADSVDGLEKAKWYGPNGRDSYYSKNNQKIRHQYGEWMQYQITFDIKNGSKAPVVDKVEIILKEEN